MPLTDIGGTNPNAYLINLGDLADVFTDNKADGYILQYNEASGLFVLVPGTGFGGGGGGGGGATALTGLTDVSISNPTSNNALLHNGTNWVNRAIRLADLSGVTFVAPANGQVLWYSGGIITNLPLPFHLLSGVSINGASNGQVLGFNGTLWTATTLTVGASRLSGLLDVNVSNSGQGSILEINGGQWIASPTLNLFKRSYLSGVRDLAYEGVVTNGQDITASLQNFILSAPSNINIRIPAGNYTVSNTIQIDGKHGWNIDARQANFYEANRLPSGIFRFYGCSELTWDGGYFSGADTLSYILGIASGIELSGRGMEDLNPNDASVRYILGQVFDTHICTGINISNVRVTNKYKVMTDNNSIKVRYSDIRHIGVHTGNMARDDETIIIGITGTAPLTGLASVELGAIFKETARTTYTFALNKTKQCIISQSYSKNTGGLLVAGSLSIGGGGGSPEQIVITDCFGNNMYDNGIYLSSCHKCTVDTVRIINDSTLPHSIEGIKARGSDNVFINCYVEHANHAYGFEGYGNTSDYWNGFQSQGWSSEGCRIINCTAKDVRGHGIYLDRNNDIYPRDCLVAYNDFYNCGLGPWGRSPTGYKSNDTITSPVIRAVDGIRARIIGNRIEHTGSFAPDYSIYVGSYYYVGYITGCEIADNIIIGAKRGIYLNNLDSFVVRNNTAERLGFHGQPFVIASGQPAMIICNNVKNGRIYDNTLTPTGHACMMYVNPDTTFENIRYRDNDGYNIFN